MPSYFFHLVFELYPHPQGNRGERDFFLPPSGTDIFQASFPSHKSPGWLQSSNKRQHGRFKSTAFEDSSYTLKDHTQAKHDQAAQSPFRSATGKKPAGQPHGFIS